MFDTQHIGSSAEVSSY